MLLMTPYLEADMDFLVSYVINPLNLAIAFLDLFTVILVGWGKVLSKLKGSLFSG